MPDGTVILPELDRFAGLRGFTNNLVAGLMQQRQQQQAAQQLQQLFGQGFPAGLTSPIAQTAGIQQALQRQRIAGQAQAPPTIAGLRGLEATRTGARPGTRAFERIAAGPPTPTIPSLTDLRVQAALAKGLTPGTSEFNRAVRTPLTPTQEIKQETLNRLRRLQAIPSNQRTPAQQASIEKILEGQAQVQVTIGEKDIRRDTLQQRSEFAKDGRVKDIRVIEKFTRNVETAYDRSLTSKNLGLVDITLAKSFQKLTDLGSTVREGEFATTFEGQRLINKIRGKTQALLKGGLGFTPEDRKEIRDLSLALEQDSRRLFNQAFDEFSITAEELGLNKRAIFGGSKKFDIVGELQKQQPTNQTELDAINREIEELEAKL